MEQSYEADGSGWVYCDAKTNEPELPQCECMDSWLNTEETCAGDPMELRGCPTSAEVGQCEEDSRSWCYTKDSYCREQNSHDDNKDEGWVFCDPTTQRAISAPKAAAIGITFIATVILCTSGFIGLLYAYRAYTRRKRVSLCSPTRARKW